MASATKSTLMTTPEAAAAAAAAATTTTTSASLATAALSQIETVSNSPSLFVCSGSTPTALVLENALGELTKGELVTHCTAGNYVFLDQGWCGCVGVSLFYVCKKDSMYVVCVCKGMCEEIREYCIIVQSP